MTQTVTTRVDLEENQIFNIQNNYYHCLKEGALFYFGFLFCFVYFSFFEGFFSYCLLVHKLFSSIILVVFLLFLIQLMFFEFFPFYFFTTCNLFYFMSCHGLIFFLLFVLYFSSVFFNFNNSFKYSVTAKRESLNTSFSTFTDSVS